MVLGDDVNNLITSVFDSKNAGENKMVTIISLKGNDASNYSILIGQKTKANVTVKDLIVTANNSSKRVGGKDPILTFNTNGLVGTVATLK